MGGQTQQNQQQQTVQATTPWAPAAGTISSLLGQLNGINPNLTGTESGALGQLSALGAAGNPFQGGVNTVANNLLAGGGANKQTGLINNAYRQYQAQLNPYLQASFLDPRNTPGFSDALAATNADITNQINGQFAAAGRDLSGMHTQALARGLSQGEGALIANQYNENVADQLGAMGSLYGAGNTTGGLLSQLQQQSVANQQAGIPAAQQALQGTQYGPLLELQAEAQRRGIPLQTLASEMGIALPVGQAFGTTVGNQTGQMTTSVPLAQQIIGGMIGGAGLLGGTGAFGANGWLGPLFPKPINSSSSGAIY
jgi:hypothetical protein